VADPPGMEAVDPAGVVASFETMARLYRSLWRLSQRQRRLIETGDTAALMRVLGARQAILDRLKEIQPGVERAVEGWRSQGSAMAAPIRQRIRELLDETSDLLKRVMAADTEDSQRLAVRRATVADRLDRQQQVEQAARAYRAASAVRRPDRLDLKDRSE